jgi:hypothetical protein
MVQRGHEIAKPADFEWEMGFDILELGYGGLGDIAGLQLLLQLLSDCTPCCGG